MAVQNTDRGHTTGKTVLVVEDDAACAAMIEAALHDGGYRVITTAGAERALQYLHQGKPDLVLSDVVLPRLDGHSLARALAANPDLRAVPVVLMSGMREPGPDGVFAAFLKKPFTLDGLLAVVEEHIGKPDH